MEEAGGKFKAVIFRFNKCFEGMFEDKYIGGICEDLFSYEIFERRYKALSVNHTSILFIRGRSVTFWSFTIFSHVEQHIIIKTKFLNFDLRQQCKNSAI